jgi:hypothetical protein
MRVNPSNLPEPPVHFLSAIAIIALDMIWSAFEIGSTVTICGLLFLPALSASVFVVALLTVLAVQLFIARDQVGPAIAKAMVLAVLAAVPFPIMGTAVGVPLLAWSGLRQLGSGRPSR